ncbi:ATP-binding protein [Flexistipes sp.]|uniref:ATP-binding protein n=1 Tax=Flexistipes sp. TaxID=3088135 RepID=UPI002E1BE8BC|nr:4Fe-4S binding protein [Flexistipes sp.]
MKTAYKLLDNLNKNISYVNHSCLRFRHKNNGCNKCISNCPSGAISLSSYRKRINIDWNKCLGCLSCSTICPTEVFWPKTGEIKNFIESAFNYLKNCNNLRVACKNSKKFIEADEVLYVPSMLMISHVYLLMFTYKSLKEIDFIVSNCDQCDISKCKNHLSVEIEKLENALLLFGRDMPKIGIYNAEKYDKSKHINDRTIKNNTFVTRREMFGLLKKRAKDSLGSSFSMLENKDDQRMDIAENYRLPKKRQLLLDLLDRIDQKKPDVLEKKANLSFLGFTEIVIDTEKCTKCEVCTKICPTGALHAGCNEKGESKIFFITAYCVNCGLCEISCLNNAISRIELVDMKEISNKNRLYLK